MGPRKRVEKRRKERNPIKLEELEDSPESPEEGTEDAVREKKAKIQGQKKYIGAHVSIAGKTHTDVLT